MTNLIPPSISEELPSMVRNELSKLSPQKQEEFLEEYKRKRKSVAWAYVAWLFGLHYAYLSRWGLLILYWLTGAGFLIWAIVDLFRIPSLVRNYNKDVAVNVMRNLKAISS
jgi:hypothetical protein